MYYNHYKIGAKLLAMTRIRDLLIAWRVRRARQLTNSDSVSFEAFCNEAPPLRRPSTKESSLTEEYSSPKHNKVQFCKII